MARTVVLGPDASDPDRNPCTFKTVCRSCGFCEQERRPTACIELKCEYYTPCTKCHKNLPLNPQGLCELCIPKSEIQVHKSLQSLAKHESLDVDQVLDGLGLPDDPAISTRKFEITLPGMPPGQYTQSEKDYYLAQWREYKGFFRDPSAYAICHNIILMEIELNWVSSFILNHRGSSVVKEIEKKQSQIIDNLRTLRQQLPEKEAQDLSDDEKSIGMIYNRYLEETKARRVGKLSRVLSPEAYVLADQLPFKINPFNILQRMGYKPVEAAEAADKFIDPKDVPTDGTKLLEFLGLHLREKFASPDGQALDDLDQGNKLGITADSEIPTDFLVESPTKFSQLDQPEILGPSLSDGLTSDHEGTEGGNDGY